MKLDDIKVYDPKTDGLDSLNFETYRRLDLTIKDINWQAAIAMNNGLQEKVENSQIEPGRTLRDYLDDNVFVGDEAVAVVVMDGKIQAVHTRDIHEKLKSSYQLAEDINSIPFVFIYDPKLNGCSDDAIGIYDPKKQSLDPLDYKTYLKAKRAAESVNKTAAYALERELHRKVATSQIEPDRTLEDYLDDNVFVGDKPVAVLVMDGKIHSTYVGEINEHWNNLFELGKTANSIPFVFFYDPSVDKYLKQKYVISLTNEN